MESIPPLPLLTFPDQQSGANYISRLPLANPAAAQEQIDQFLDSLLTVPPERNELLSVLEALRGPLAFVEEEMAKRFHNKALPLADFEEGIFRQVLAIWRKLGKAYALCLEPGSGPVEDADAARRLATVLHRQLQCAGMVILEHYRARRELPPGLWLEFHGHFLTAEERGVALEPVPNGAEGAVTCSDMYVTLVLIDLGGPYSQSVRDINLTRRWAAQWAPLLVVERLASVEEPPPYVLKLEKDAGLHPVGEDQAADTDLRRLDSTRLTRRINEVLGELRQKTPPSQLGLGEESAGRCIGLLEQLLRPWSQSAVARKFRRFAASGTARVAVGFEAMHFFVSGRPFEQPEASSAYAREEFNTLFSARGMASPNQRPVIRAQEEYAADQWEVINHSATGFRLARSAVGQKMAHGQLLAVCPHDGDKFLLAQSTWLMQEQAGGLVAGVAVLPGLPTAIAIRLNV
ncbi:MAG TPA: hypothetical protein VFF03_10905, partial [Rhodocyclaceae bacterium]|nr:hypothetical protein [Rhodocyclaceae bacterium]